MKKIVESSGLRLWAEGLGNPKHTPCILISGAGASAMFWSDAFCQQLIDQNYFVICFDHRDQGMSDGVDWEMRSYTVMELAKDVIAILDAYNIQKAHVVGHSMGGAIAILLALFYPERLLTFSSMSAAPVGAHAQPPKQIMDVLMQNKPTQNYAKDLPGFLEVWNLLNGDYALDLEKAKTYTRDLYMRSMHEVGVAWNHIKCQEKFQDLRGVLKKNRVPGLLIHGEKDLLIPVAGAKELDNLLPFTKLMVIPGMGHMIFNAELENKILTLLLKHFSVKNT